ncbi:hypothetical protein DYB38_008543 [Aphanomyces astaci]|uniref:DDE-1 domain-containing protein n=1 Tax=Aphanomyces astaci TaxID=112090 RepID=A0A397CEC5_APHAT|nr:hypothetical protein DYB38_008543 [Aphanomyces astaci]
MTMQSKGDKTVWIKCGGKTKDRATAMFLANSNGDKLPMFLVLKTTASKVKSVVQENLTQRHGFGKQVWKQNRPDRSTKKVLLLWDDFSAHFTDEVVECARELNVVLEKVPPRFMWICQPADIAWIRPMKTRLRQLWIDLIRRQVRHHKHQATTFKLVPPSRATIVR